MTVSGNIRSRRNPSLLQIIVVIAILVLGTVMIVWSAQSSLQIRSVEASLFVELRNEMDFTFNLSGFIYVYGKESIQFVNTDIEEVRGENLTVVEIEGGSGIQLYMPKFEPGGSIEFQINNIQVDEALHRNVSSLRFDPTFHDIYESDIGYRAIFKIIGKTKIGAIPAASKYIFTVRFAEKNVLIISESRTMVLEYLDACMHAVLL